MLMRIPDDYSRHAIDNLFCIKIAIIQTCFVPVKSIYSHVELIRNINC